MSSDENPSQVASLTLLNSEACDGKVSVGLGTFPRKEALICSNIAESYLLTGARNVVNLNLDINSALTNEVSAVDGIDSRVFFSNTGNTETSDNFVGLYLDAVSHHQFLLVVRPVDDRLRCTTNGSFNHQIITSLEDLLARELRIKVDGRW